ncbi:MAG TPA: phosphate ABC transporter ATP-binding protein [Symbiobacteriaceae bacterium]|nr:phosphate ABC transporter ATP-binding protein [Symbiobacteriaceae bacterium]
MTLQVENLSVFYGSNQALTRASLNMPDTAVTALIGPSGCGKSTFLRALNRMHDLVPGTRVTGSIRLDGQEIGRLKAEELRCRVGMVFQRPNPFPMSIYENVAFGPSLQGASRHQLDHIVEESLKRAALWDEVKRRLGADARALSGGQQQRLCIARALAMRPAVLLMDEPCSALDPGSTQAVEELILALQQDMSIVIVTHSMGQARRVADQVAFFYSGRLLEVGPAILDHPQTKELSQFLTL